MKQLPQRIRELILNKQTDYDRWSNPESIQKPWVSRTLLAVRKIEGARSVADIGCGGMHVLTHLSPNCKYIPLDIVKRSNETLICDVNKGIWPKVSADAVLALGLLEYIYDFKKFVEAVRNIAPTLVFSYTFSPGDSVPTEDEVRLRMGWLSNFSYDYIVKAVNLSAGVIVSDEVFQDKTFGCERLFVVHFSDNQSAVAS